MGRLQRGMRNDEIDALHSSDAQLDPSVNLQEYLAHWVAVNPHDLDKLCQPPTSDDKGKGKETDSEGSQPDVNVWIYESLRRLCEDLNTPWLVSLQQTCTRETCPQMKAGEWLYLCAAHTAANEVECCAIDYIEHTLDAASALLNSSRYFPSRISISPACIKHFASIARRLYRIFGHAYYHHLELFQDCEAETSLYSRFKKLSLTYNLAVPQLLAVPASFDDPPAEEEQDSHSRT